MDQQAIDDFGIIVDNPDGQELKELDIDEAVKTIRVPHSLFNKFVIAAHFNKYLNVEAWASATLVNSLTTKIRAPSFDSPDLLNNQEAKKITGPSNSGLTRRG